MRMRARRSRAPTACGPCSTTPSRGSPSRSASSSPARHLALGEVAAARTVFAETEAVLERRPDLGLLVEDAQELRERLAATEGSAGTWAMSLTGAELRLLPYLATHLTFLEIGARLYISHNTVKTEALAIYRKLGASSRSKAIERAVEVGLLDGSIYPPRGQSHPRWMTRGAAAEVNCCGPWASRGGGAGAMDDYKEHLRRLAVHEDAFVDALALDGSSFAASVLDERATALVRVAATIAVDAAPSSFQHAVSHALAAGATKEEVVATLEAVMPVTGAARVVSSAAKLGLALGYDVEAALERFEP